MYFQVKINFKKFHNTKYTFNQGIKKKLMKI